MRNWMEDVWKVVWSHRATYGGLALAYGAGCLGVLDKATVSQIATACYVALVMQRH